MPASHSAACARTPPSIAALRLGPVVSPREACVVVFLRLARGAARAHQPAARASNPGWRYFRLKAMPEPTRQRAQARPMKWWLSMERAQSAPDSLAAAMYITPHEHPSLDRQSESKSQISCQAWTLWLNRVPLPQNTAVAVAAAANAALNEGPAPPNATGVEADLRVLSQQRLASPQESAAQRASS